jgi:hypothetical protein
MIRKNTLESIAMTVLKKGQIFYSHKQDKDLTAISSYYKVKIKTERCFIINNLHTKIKNITKVTIL